MVGDVVSLAWWVTYVNRCQLSAFVHYDSVLYRGYIDLIEVDIEFPDEVGLIWASLWLTRLVPRVVVGPPCTIHD